MLRTLTGLVCGAAMAATIACAQSDPGITTAVKSKLAADDTVKAYQIDVDTRDRVVTLTGTVDRAAAKEQAVIIARRTDGVRDVVDHITVGPEPAATTGLRDDAREAGREIREEVREATDAAKAESREAKEKAENAADKAGNVLTDAAVTTAVKSKFLADTTVKGLNIDVDTKDGVVTLNGSVTSKAEADQAIALARETSGVKRVVNNLRMGR